MLLEVPPDQAASLALWAHLLETPKTALQEVATDPQLNVEPAALIAGFDKLARLDAPSAAILLPRLLERPELTAAMQLRLRKSAALGSAFGRDSGAVEAFAALPESVTDADVQEWRVRAALWAGDWQQALSWIAPMPPSLASQPRWKYWRARCIEATAGKDAANPLYEELAGLRDFYGYLAADRLHRPYMLNARPSAEDMPVQATLAADPGLIRARALFEADMEEEAAYEWAAVIGGANPTVRLQAAHLAAHWGWYSQSIITLSQLGALDDVRMRYPRPYTDAIAEASKLTQLPTDWILAVMRQESLFRDDAVSRAGARGLMQMEPATAAAVARRWHLPQPSRDGGVDPVADIERGAAHLRELLDRYGQLGLTLAAYNAGAVPVARWLPAHPLDADIWIENIPYSETRNYVQRIIEHIVAFAWVRDAEPPRLAVLLPEVSGSTLAAQTARP
ncbi:MAG: lytic transglycosylase domain-containing protein [Sinobacteraceae bacterium]|nr:lytic transglycosylase domain-containing protein [Nevskiaceae bacterium]